MALFEDTKDSLRLAGRVGPGGDDELRHSVQVSATIEEVTVRIYRGAELDVQVTPAVAYDADEDRASNIPLITFVDGGKQFVDGDGDRWDFPVSVPVTEGDEIVVEVENQDPDNGYDYAVDVVLEKAAGSTRLDQIVGVLG